MTTTILVIFAVIAIPLGVFGYIVRKIVKSKVGKEQSAKKTGTPDESALSKNLKDYFKKKEGVAAIIILIGLVLVNVLMSEFGWNLWRVLRARDTLFLLFWISAFMVGMAFVYAKRDGLKFLGTIGYFMIALLVIGWWSIYNDHKDWVRAHQSQPPPQEVVSHAALRSVQTSSIELQLKAGEWSETVYRQPWFPKARFIPPTQDFQVWVNDEPSPKKSVNGEVWINGVYVKKLRVWSPVDGTFTIYDGSK